MNTNTIRYRQIQKKIPGLQELYRKNHWPEQWFYDILREFHIWSLYSLRHGGKYQIPEEVNGWFDMIFSGRLIRIGRLEFDLKAHFGGKIFVFRNDKNLTVLSEPGLIFNDRGYRSDSGWTSSFEENDSFWMGNRILNGVAEQKITNLKKEEWELVLQYGDPMFSIHIPEDGPITKESCLHSLQEAANWFWKSDSAWKGFFCQSWLLDPVFAKILSETSNIVQFQTLGTLYPMGAKSEIAERVYPGKLLNLIKQEETQGHVFMQEGMFLLKDGFTYTRR